MRLSRGRFLGSLLSSRRIGGFTLTDYAYAPHLKLGQHGHEQAYVCMVLEGGYVEACGRETRTCGRSTMTIHPAGEVHADSFERAGGRIFSVEVDPSWAQRVREVSTVLERSSELQGGTVTALISRMYGEFRRPDRASPLAIEGLVLEVLAEAARRIDCPGPGRPPQWLVQARDLLHDRFAESLTLGLIAAEVGIHPVHLVREFRRHFGSTMGGYVRRLRVDHACRQLAESDTALVEIALEAGFAHQSHFSHVFKRLTGMTPTEYRAASRR